MPMLIKVDGDQAVLVDDGFVLLGEEDPAPDGADVIVSLARFQSEGDSLMACGRRVGVRLQPSEEAEALAYDLPRLAVVELRFDIAEMIDDHHALDERIDQIGDEGPDEEQHRHIDDGENEA